MRGSQGVRRGLQGPGVAWLGAETLVGRGWALAIPISGYGRVGRVVPGIVPSQYPPLHPTQVHPATAPRHGPPVLQCGPDETVSLSGPKEILGVDNAHYTRVSLRPRTPTLTPALPVSLPGSLGGLSAGSGLASVLGTTALRYCRLINIKLDITGRSYDSRGPVIS